ncbi:MAG TPA: molybdopterin-synthase adenylyltransferase MoeB [Gemmatimonadales bacterium]|nr:molybdopterin-synthase adenylyltransferase MoeB [Gemmatimonadales bacterium]
MSLSHDELIRYSRHLILPEVGVEGQRRLKAARVLVVGAGGLGSPVALYLAAAGVGTIGLADGDVLDLSNLQRQVLHGTASVGHPKVESGAARLRDLNPHVRVEPIAERLTSANAREVVRAFDVVADGSDNFPTRYLINDACVLEAKPNAYGAILRFDGQASFFAPEGPCYRCLFAEPPPPGLVPSCAEAGVVGALPGLIGSIQALEVIKRIVGAGESLLGRLLLVDALRMRTREIAVRRDPACPVCGEAPTIRELVDYEAFCGVPGTGAAAAPGSVEPAALAGEIAAGGQPLLLDVREPWEWEVVHLEGALHVPLGDLPSRLGDLDPREPIVTLCHHGVRSRRAQELLTAAGFSGVRNLAGGIDAWAEEVEPGMARY